MSSKQKVSTPKAKRNNNKNSIPRSKRTVKPQPNDETFMKIIVQFHNQRDQQINAEKIYAYKTNLKSLPENLKKQLEDAFGGNIPETKRFPPGKDKIQFIQKYWIDNKIATYKKKRLAKWRCYCHISPGRNDFQGFWQNPSFFVQAHTEGYLKSVELRPYSNAEAATKAERTMAHRLRKQGCGVWAGHHDRKS